MIKPFIAFLADGAPARQGSSWQTIGMLVIGFAFLYFIMWRPEQKRRKQAEQMRNMLKKGDVVTAMGIIGTVSRVDEKTVIVKMVDGAKVEFLKAAITEVQPSKNEDAAEVEAKGKA